MTKEQDKKTIPFIELMYCLFEDAVKKGEIPPGEYVTVISDTAQPGYEQDEGHWEGEIPDIREPVSERHEHGGCMTITVDLPGTYPEDIRHTLHHGVLYLAAHAGSVIYRAAYPVEGEAAETLTRTVKNGVVEFTYKKQGRKSEKIRTDTKKSDTF